MPKKAAHVQAAIRAAMQPCRPDPRSAVQGKVAVLPGPAPAPHVQSVLALVAQPRFHSTANPRQPGAHVREAVAAAAGAPPVTGPLQLSPDPRQAFRPWQPALPALVSRFGTLQLMESSKKQGETLALFAVDLRKGSQSKKGSNASGLYIDVVVTAQFDTSGGHDPDGFKFSQHAGDVYRVYGTDGSVARESCNVAWKWDKYNEDSLLPVFGKAGLYQYLDTPGWSNGSGFKCLSSYHIFCVSWTMTSSGTTLVPNQQFFIPFAETADGTEAYPGSTIQWDGSKWTYDPADVFTDLDSAARNLIDGFKHLASDEEKWFDLRKSIV